MSEYFPDTAEYDPSRSEELTEPPVATIGPIFYTDGDTYPEYIDKWHVDIIADMIENTVEAYGLDKTRVRYTSVRILDDEEDSSLVKLGDSANIHHWEEGHANQNGIIAYSVHPDHVDNDIIVLDPDKLSAEDRVRWEDRSDVNIDDADLIDKTMVLVIRPTWVEISPEHVSGRSEAYASIVKENLREEINTLRTLQDEIDESSFKHIRDRISNYEIIQSMLHDERVAYEEKIREKQTILDQIDRIIRTEAG